MTIPPFIFDKIWRSKYATAKYVKNILSEKIDFKNKSVLDFGCGTGAYCTLFEPDGYLGVDINKNRIEYAKKKHSQYTFLCNKDINLEKIGRSFDFVFLISILHHLSDKECIENIRKFHQILKSHGRVVVMEPCLFPFSWFNNWFMKFIDMGKYIRTEENYKMLFDNLFNVVVHKKFKRHFVYNEIFFSARKK